VTLSIEPASQGGRGIASTRVGIYLNAPATEFVEWLESWSRQCAKTAFAVGQYHVLLGAARKRVLLSQHLLFEIPGTLSGIRDIPDDLAVPVSFQVLPVGRGASVEVIGTSDIQGLLPYLVEFVSAATNHWPLAAANVWFGEPPSHPVELYVLNIPTTISVLERELSQFAAGFSSLEIRSVTILPISATPEVPTEEQATRRQTHNNFRLSLHSAVWQGIDHIDLECIIARLSAKRPLTLTLRCHGFQYPEIASFTVAIIDYCRSRWSDTQVSGVANHSGALAATSAGKKRREGGLVTEQTWTMADRPWELVADVAWDRLLLELWWKNSTAAAIGNKVGVTAKTVVNRLYELRKTYGASIVLTETQRRGRGKEKLGYPG